MASTTKRVLLAALVLFFPLTLAGLLLIARTVHSDAEWWAFALWAVLIPSSIVASLLDHIAQEHMWFMHFVVLPLALAVQYGYCVALVILVRKLSRSAYENNAV